MLYGALELAAKILGICEIYINHNHLRRVVNPDMDRMHTAACGHNHLRLGIRALIHPIVILRKWM